MAIKAEEPEGQRENPFAPKGPDPLVFEQFRGINQNTTRAGVPDEQMWWCENWMPLSERNLRTMPDIGPGIFAVVTLAPGTSIVFFGFANIGPLPVCIVFLSDGSIWQVGQAGSGTVQIAPAGTIVNPIRTNVGMSQWGSQYVIIVAGQPNGYWLWDGTQLYTSGSLSPGVVLTNPGSGYSSVPTVTAFGGNGSGATFAATVAAGVVTSVSITNFGHGYQATDVVGLAFSGGGIVGRTAILTPIVSSGTLSSVVITDAGDGYVIDPAPTAAVLGGGGGGAAITLNVTNHTIASVSITSAGSGYLSRPTIIVTDPNNQVAQAEVSLMPFAVQGTDVETYQGRVWIIDGADLIWSAPGAVSDFATSNGGGAITSNDSFLRVGYTALKASNGFLYLVADSSMNYISNVTTSDTPPTTTFTNLNADPEVGSAWPGSVGVFGRNVIFANDFGAHICYGAAVTKISEPLDGIYNTVPFFGGFVPSAAKAIIYGKKVWMLLLPVIDPITGDQDTKLFLWNENKKAWWAATQSVDLKFIQSQEINSLLTAFGTDGSNIYPLFQLPSTALTKTVQTKLWTGPGGYQWTKTSVRLWGLFTFQPGAAVTAQATIDVSIENENGEAQNADYTFTSPKNSINVVNQSGTIIPCKNASNVTIPVYSYGNGNFVFDPQAIGQKGVMTGFTVDTTAADLTMISMMMQDEIAQYRG